MQESNLPKRQYTEEFMTEAVRLIEFVGGHEATRRLGVPVATLGNWKRRRAAAGTTGAVAPEVASSAAVLVTRRPVSELETENSKLRRELADAKLDVEILRKAAARSTGQCNAGGEFIARRCEPQRFARPGIELQCSGVELSLREANRSVPFG